MKYNPVDILKPTIKAAILVCCLIGYIAYGQQPAATDYTPETLNRHLTRLAPRLIDATVAVMVPPGSGSGVIVTPEGLVMTAAHVTNTPGKEVTVILSDGRELPATTLGVDHGTDGGLLKINAPGPFPFRPYITEKNYQVGDWVIASGHPGGPIKGRLPPIRLGRITADGTDSGFSNPITSTTTIISGDSGGPLFNLDGEVIGINSNIGRSYFLNNHVPVPSMLKQWQPMLDGETLGKSKQAQQQTGNIFDEPYAPLREQFIEELKKQSAQDKEAAELLARPRLLDPHHMQEKLDRWTFGKETEAKDDDGEKQSVVKRKLRPWLGFKPDLSAPGTVRIDEVIPDSPAETSGLIVGDEIIAINDIPIENIADLAVELAKVESLATLELSLNDDRKLNIVPEMRPERKLFPAPVAGMIQMQITDGVGPNLNSSSRLGLLSDKAKNIYENTKTSVVAISRDDKTLALATVISINGELITKASQLGTDHENLTCRQGAVKVMAIDPVTDLALLKTSATNLSPVTWNDKEPRVASLVFGHGVKNPLAGVVTQRARISPPSGYETAQSSSAPQVWLGVQFTPASVEPIVGRVTLSSPADVAGLLEGDEIIAIQGKKIATPEDVNERLRNFSIGDKIVIKVDRSGEQQSIDLILEKTPDDLSNFSKMAKARDEKLAATSRWGGELNKRRNNFPRCIYHDIIIKPNECGSPVFDLEGNAIGINIARSFRHRSLALPAKEVQNRIRRLRAKAKW